MVNRICLPLLLLFLFSPAKQNRGAKKFPAKQKREANPIRYALREGMSAQQGSLTWLLDFRNSTEGSSPFCPVSLFPLLGFFWGFSVFPFFSFIVFFINT